MKKQTFVLSILTAGLIAAPTFAAQAQGCCSGMGAMSGGMNMSGQTPPATPPTAAADKLPQPAAAVFDNYGRIQTALAQDSLQDITTEAHAIAKVVSDDAVKTFSTKIGQQAEAVAKATDLNGAREAFKPLSQSLIEYASKNPAVAGVYRQVHCSMANADWLQKESTVNNPYMGKAMARCGEFVKTSSPAASGKPDNSMPGMKM